MLSLQTQRIERLERGVAAYEWADWLTAGGLNSAERARLARMRRELARMRSERQMAEGEN